jgi:hypothetical protein
MKCVEQKLFSLPGNAGRSRTMPAAAQVDGADWDLMFRAVMARLRTSAGQPQDGLYLPADAGISAPSAAIVLDCVRALERLHAMQLQARGPQRGG